MTATSRCNKHLSKLLEYIEQNYTEDVSLSVLSEKFELFLGDNLQDRKEYIAENGHLYIDLADIS